MTLEVLVSTMKQDDFSILKQMNINSDALIINQCKTNDYKETEKNGCLARMLYINDRGLSKSRNCALDNANADICILADDDVVYNDNYSKIVISAHEKYVNYDIIAFQVPTTNKDRIKTYSKGKKKINMLNSFRIASYEISLKRESIADKEIKFNEDFGAGSGKYLMGEENIFLGECIRQGLKILYLPIEIGYVTHENSTWLDKRKQEYFISKGAFFTEISRITSWILIAQFALRKYPIYKNDSTILEAIKYMNEGRKKRLAERTDS